MEAGMESMDLFEREERILAQRDKLFYSIMCGVQDNNVKFSDLQKILSDLGFQRRVKGDHFIYWKEGVEEIINIQPNKDKAKPYQVKLVRNIILKYGMVIQDV